MTHLDAQIERGDKFVRQLIEKAAAAKSFGRLPAAFRKIIDCTTYSSKTMARLTSYIPRDLPQWAERREVLYQTRNGRFLVAGEGREYSPWSKDLPDCEDRLLGHAFVPVSAADARQWMDLRDLGHVIADIFGDPADETKVSTEILIRLPPTIARRLVMEAQNVGMTTQAWCQKVLTETHWG